MPYDYYCTNCGRKITQDEVLFDMQYLLTKNKDKKFNILKFRMRLAELEEWFKTGFPTEDGFKKLKLTFVQFFQIVSNFNNLNDPAIAGITLEDVRNYVGTIDFDSFAEAAPAPEEDDIFGLGSAAPQPEPEMPAQPEEHLSEAMLALQRKDESNKDRGMTRAMLSADLENVKNLFANGGCCEFQVAMLSEKDNEGAQIVTGYRAWPNLFIDAAAEPRVCPKCGYPVFAHAGTAKHHRVVFFGPQSAGKTSLLLALTHYACNAMLENFSSEIWGGTEPIRSIKTVELLNRKPQRSRSAETGGASSDLEKRNRSLYSDLELYEKGIAPEKTGANLGVNAYNATFRIQDARGRFHLLTLTDLPGELIDEDTGAINTADMVDKFPTALSCDAYVICFDTSKKGKEQVQINATLQSADAVQKLHADGRRSDAHIPLIVVYTKCSDIEQQSLLQDPAVGSTRGNMIQQAHMFYGECERIRENPAYAFVLRQFDNYQNLKDSFKTGIRCSAYGYNAPTRADIEQYGREACVSRPHYVDQLMKWILMVCGCAPVRGRYKATFNSVGWEEAENYITRLQFRKDKPLRSDDLREALARVILFENPGDVDVALVQAHGSKAALTAARVHAMLPGSKNHKE